MEKQLLFIHSISQRSGHNLLAQIIRKELTVNHIFGKSYEAIGAPLFSRSWVWNNKNEKFVRAKKARNTEISLLTEGYRDKILRDFGNTLLKNPSLVDSSQIQLFPKDKHLVLIRNPYDLFISVEKSIYNFRNNSFKKRFKKVIRPVYSFYYLIKWRKNIRKGMISASELSKDVDYCLVLPFEYLHSLSMQQKLFDFLRHKPKNPLPIVIQTNINSSFLDKENQWKENNQQVGNPLRRFENAPFWIKMYCLLLRKEKELYSKIFSSMKENTN